MRLLLSWAREFVDIPASLDDVAETLGLRGFEVAAVERIGADDGVIDFEVTANRPDALSVIGLAREIATAYDRPLMPPTVRALPRGEAPEVTVAIEDADLCARYVAAVAQVTPTRTPAFMSERLEASGVRAISPFVDLTNYVLLETGHPMHAFDLDRLADWSLRARRARAGEAIVTLDGVTRTLDPEMLVIADASAPQAIAGVMGGRASEVSDATHTVVFESAWFKPASVRRTSKRLGLKTEASFRFERGADVSAPVIALERAIDLMQQIGAGRLMGPIVDRYPRPRGPKTIQLRRARLAALLGLTIPDHDVVRILRGLGLDVVATGEGWTTTVPTFRVDLVREVDLIEEVGRHYGFDRLEPSFPPSTAAAAPPDERLVRDRLVRRVLLGAGFDEAVTFGFIERKAADAFTADVGREAIVAVANPLSGKFDTLRPSLLPGLVDAVAHNRRHGRRDVALFEIGARFTADGGETRGVAIAWTGAAAEHWSTGRREVDFFDVKGCSERLAVALGAAVSWQDAEVPYLASGQSAAVLASGIPVGCVGRLDPAVADSRGAPRQDAIIVAELDLDRLTAGRAEAATTVRPLPRHPFVVRDLSIVVPDTLPAEIIRGTIHSVAGAGRAPLAAIAFFDRYKGKGLPDGSISLSIRLTFQAPESTLTDADVQDSFDAIVTSLVREHGAAQR